MVPARSCMNSTVPAAAIQEIAGQERLKKDCPDTEHRTLIRIKSPPKV